VNRGPALAATAAVAIVLVLAIGYGMHIALPVLAALVAALASFAGAAVAPERFLSPELPRNALMLSIPPVGTLAVAPFGFAIGPWIQSVCWLALELAAVVFLMSFPLRIVARWALEDRPSPLLRAE
jgi:hypothetical protein